MLASWATTTVTVWRAPLVTRRGASVRDWPSATPHAVSGCEVQPRDPAEDRRGERRAREIRATLRAPAGADIEDGDRVSVGGTDYEVVGAPMEWPSPRGGTSHVECVLSDWRG